jgi:mannosyltransferase
VSTREIPGRRGLAPLPDPSWRERGRDSLVANRRVWIDVGAVTALAAVVRLTTLGLQSYELDEAATLYVINGSFGDMLDGVARYESTPPLYYVLAWVWAQAFGTGEVGLRLLSALAGVAIVPIVYAVGRTLASHRIGLVAAAIVATNPYLVFYSQEVRSYALYALLSAASVLCCVLTIRDPRARTLGLWAAVSLAALATHYFALFQLVGEVVALAVFGVPRRLLAGAAAALGLVSIPLLPLVRHQATQGHVDWIGASGLVERMRVTAETFTLGATFKGTLPHSVLAVCGLFAVVIACAIVTAVVLLIRRAGIDERRAAVVCGVIAAVAIGLPLIGALGPADYFIHKNLIPVVPLLAVVLAAGLACRRAGRAGIAGAVALVLTGSALTVLSFAVPSLRRPDIRLVSRQLGPPVRERVLVFIPRWRLLLEHYQGKLDDLPPAGRRVSEVDVFTAGPSIPGDTVPRGFRLTRVQHGHPFTVFTFRSQRPLAVTSARLGRRTFAESGLQPTAVVQTPR